MILSVTILFSLNAITQSNFCNIQKVDLSYISEQKELPEMPIILVSDPKRQAPLITYASRDNLLENFGATEVVLSSSNTYSHGKFISTLEEYITTSVDASSQFANETFYLFGNNYDGIFNELSNIYLNPPCYYCDIAGVKTLGIGGHASGVSFHLHGPGFSEAIIGRKRWFLFPPSMTKYVSSFNPNMTMAQWVDHIYPQLLIFENQQQDKYLKQQVISDYIFENYSYFSSNNDMEIGFNRVSNDFNQSIMQALSRHLYECTIGPGEVLYFPSMWMHATLNLDAYNVFMSLFIDPQLMK